MGDSSDNEGGEIQLPSCIPQPELSGKWYRNDIAWSEHWAHEREPTYECVRECPGSAPCYGRAPLNEKLFDTFNECCQEYTWWTDCSVTSSNPSHCSDAYWDTYDEWDNVGYYPVCKFLFKIFLNCVSISLLILVTLTITSPPTQKLRKLMTGIAWTRQVRLIFWFQQELYHITGPIRPSRSAAEVTSHGHRLSGCVWEIQKMASFSHRALLHLGEDSLISGTSLRWILKKHV